MEGYVEDRKGQRIDNIPDSGTLTGNFETDHYGCWWEYIMDTPDISETWGIRTEAWIIGEYPVWTIFEETEERHDTTNIPKILHRRR